MTRHPLPWYTALSLGGIGLILAGCVAIPPSAPASRPFDLVGPLMSGGLRVRLLDMGRAVQTVPNTWTSAQFTLSSPTILTANRTESIAKTAFNDTGAGTAASTTTTLFASARAGSYTLFASTYNNSVRNALGYTSVSLVAGSAATVGITLRTLPEWTTGTLANTAGTKSFGGDAGAPGAAFLDTPKGIAFGGDGSMYVCDSANKRVRKLNAAKTTITTLAGDGTDAVLNNPSALAYDAGRDVLFIADTGNNRIRLVTSLGTAPALSGTSLALAAQPLGIAYDPSRDALYVSLANHTIVQIDTPSTTPAAPVVLVGTGTAGDSTTTAVGTSVQLNTPRGLAVDATGTYMYVADSGNRRIRRVTLADLTTTILAGTGQDAFAGDGALAASASFKAPADLAYDSTDGGRLYVLDTGAYVVRAITLANGMIASVFGNGTSAYAGDGQGAQQASLFAPSGLGLSGTGGSLYVSESGTGGHRIRSAQ